MITIEDKKQYKMCRQWNRESAKESIDGLSNAQKDPRVMTALAQIEMGSAYLDSIMKMTDEEEALDD